MKEEKNGLEVAKKDGGLGNRGVAPIFNYISDHDFERSNTGKIISYFIHVLSLIAVSHLLWVAFYIKSDNNIIPIDLYYTGAIFILVYFFVFILWLVEINFSGYISSREDVFFIINKLLFKSIEYVSPFKAGESTSRSGHRSDIPLYKAITNHYYNDLIPIFAILFSFSLISVFNWPDRAISIFPIIQTKVGFFGLMLVSFYGAGASYILLALRASCFAVERRGKDNSVKYKD